MNTTATDKASQLRRAMMRIDRGLAGHLLSPQEHLEQAAAKQRLADRLAQLNEGRYDR